MTAWPAVLQSPRRRRRLRWLGVAVVLGAIAAALIPLLRSGPRGTSEVFEPGKPVVTEQKPVPVTPDTRRGINATLVRFVRDGVGRRNLADAYDLVTPNFRGGTTLAQWRRGASPIYAYPAPAGPVANAWHVNYSYRNDVGLALMLASRHERKVGSIIFQVELLKRGGRWLVDSFAPVATFTPAGAGPQHETGPLDYTAPSGSADLHADKAPLSALWIAIPASVVALVLLVPFSFFLITRVRERRALRAFEASRASRLPPPPARQS